MADIWIFSIPAFGHIHPKLFLAKELCRRGHHIVFFGFDRWKKQIESAGAAYCSMDPYLPALSRTAEKDLIQLNTAAMTQTALQTTYNADAFLSEMVQENRPDLLIVDSVCFWGKLFALKTKIPIIVDTTTFAFNQLTANTMKPSFKEIRQIITGMPKVQRMLRKLEKLGYPKAGILDLVQSLPEQNTIVYTSRLIQPSGSLFPENYCFCGAAFSKNDFLLNTETLQQDPLFDRPSLTSDLLKKSDYLDPQSSCRGKTDVFVSKTSCMKKAELNNDLVSSRKSNGKPIDLRFPSQSAAPLIYISLGTVNNNHPEFYTNCIAALQNLNVRVLIAAGDAAPVLLKMGLPKNIQVEAYVNQRAVLKESSVFITHCGMNSVTESIFMEVPMILAPFTSEQRAVAARIQELDSGIEIKKMKPDEISEAVLTLLQDPKWKEAVQALHQSQIESGLIETAADFAEKIACNALKSAESADSSACRM